MPQTIFPAVTANAQLLLGYMAASFTRDYAPVEADPEKGQLIVENIQTKNRFLVQIYQISGTE